MNHLAHLFLAPDSAEARVGSLLGDFAKGVAEPELPAEVRRGLWHHRQVDAYTDRHPQVLASKRLFSSRRRRFAGVALDILYDHYLLKFWPAFSSDDSTRFIETTYQEMDALAHLMPQTMRRTTRRMVADDWFGHYRDLAHVGFVLDRVARRIRFTNRFEGMIEEIETHQTELEERFLSFFPQLKHKALTLADEDP